MSQRKADVEFNIGGQAVIEGVMFRGKNNWSVAVRKPDGSIAAESFPLKLKYSLWKIARLPFLRGFFVLIDTIYLGYRALEYSASRAFEDEVEISGKEFGLTAVFAVVVAVVFFILLPLWSARLAVGEQTSANSFIFSLVEGLVRLAVFVIYLAAISLMPDIRRVFQYHGAEHKVIHAFEHEGRVEPEVSKRFSPLHVSCGTSFIIFVLIIMIILHTFIRGPFLIAFLIRLALVPFVAGISYEIIRFARKHENSIFVYLLSIPGLLVQKLTTREPDDDQLEVAAESLKALLEAEGIEYREGDLADA